MEIISLKFKIKSMADADVPVNVHEVRLKVAEDAQFDSAEVGSEGVIPQKFPISSPRQLKISLSKTEAIQVDSSVESPERNEANVLDFNTVPDADEVSLEVFRES